MKGFLLALKQYLRLAESAGTSFVVVAKPIQQSAGQRFEFETSATNPSSALPEATN